MWKILGVLFVLGGVVGVLHSWILQQQKRQRKLDKFIEFLQRSIAVMETEKRTLIDYFSQTDIYELQEIARRLSTNTYANGLAVWEEVFLCEKHTYSMDDETLQLVLQAGNGFFGRNRNENVLFLKKSVRLLEKQQQKQKEKEKQERRVWVPVGVLGAVMLVIILI